MNTKPTTMIIPIDEALYNDLNRASREYEAAIVDCYYYIINGGTIDDNNFERLVSEAVVNNYAYSKLKDHVSNTVVIPAVSKEYGVNQEDVSIYDTWNIPFDGSRKCTVTNISVIEGKQETVVYSSDCPEEYIENVAKLKARIEIINSIIAKLNSTMLSDFAEKNTKLLKDNRVELMAKDAANTTAFMTNFVNPKINELGKTPENLTWSINVIDKTFSLIEKVSGVNITCTSCSACN